MERHAPQVCTATPDERTAEPYLPDTATWPRAVCFGTNTLHQ